MTSSKKLINDEELFEKAMRVIILGRIMSNIYLIWLNKDKFRERIENFKVRGERIYRRSWGADCYLSNLASSSNCIRQSLS